MKKILAIVLSAMMVFCMMPGMAFAAAVNIDSATISFDKSPAKYEYTGSAIEPNVTVTLSGQTLVKGRDYKVEYSSNTAVGVTAAVTVTGLGSGTGESGSGYTGTKTVNFEIIAKDINDVVLTHPAAFTEGTPISNLKLDLKNGTTKLVEGTDFDIAAEKQGQTAVIKGPQNVVITGKGNYKGTRIVRIEGGTDISSYVIDPIPAVTYDGTAKRPPVVVRPAVGASALSPSYYDVTYLGNVDALGNAKVIITGKNGYAGRKEALFTINPKSINYVTVSAIENQSIGSTPEPDVYDGGKKLKKGIDYSLSYSGYEYIGTATVHITGMGNYTGAVSKTYQVKDAISSYFVTVLKNAFDYTGTAITPEVTVKGPDKTYVLNRDYKIIGGGQTKAGTYKFELVGMGNYGGVFYTGEYTINKKTITAVNTTLTLSSDVAFYDGKPKEPVVTVRCDGKVLTKDVDYTVSYYNNTNIGTATVFISGMGSYYGSLNKTFRIAGKDLSSLTASLSQTSYNYTGTEHKPTVTIYDGTKKLVVGTDYTVSYKDNRNSGTATVTITGQGNYAGTKTLTFTIVGKTQLLTTERSYYTKYLTSSAFNLGAETDGDGVIAYESSDKSVATVSATGTVTIHGTGVAYITVKTTKDVKYNPTSKTVKITVKPKKPVMELSSPNSGEIKVKFTKVKGATKYQVKYGRKGSYKYKYVTHKENQFPKTSVTIKKLQPGTNYYVKVRAYKTLSDGTKVYGNWTTLTKVRTN
ncbi:fibronectin type III domain-containing protein [Ihubacter sp. mB4P-1]|uniref:fibronectin type III domain-containing protein n=1 Tax=Ihubacter sp. mB4P-1 TaxID=3242370 RepID=UPI003C7CAE5B